MDLALFDFDGTVSYKDSFTKFILFSLKRNKLFICFVKLIPTIAAYKLRIISPASTRQKVVSFCF